MEEGVRWVCVAEETVGRTSKQCGSLYITPFYNSVFLSAQFAHRLLSCLFLCFPNLFPLPPINPLFVFHCSRTPQAGHWSDGSQQEGRTRDAGRLGTHTSGCWTGPGWCNLNLNISITIFLLIQPLNGKNPLSLSHTHKYRFQLP